MIKALIVEDELYAREALMALLAKINKEIIIIGECESIKEAVVACKLTKPDVVFLDVNLVDGDGFEFLEKTKIYNYKVIFTTAHKKYAFKAIKEGAVDYVLKPYDFEELKQAIERLGTVPTKLEDDKFIKDNLVLRFQNEIQLIKYAHILYCESSNGYTTFVLEDNKSYVSSKPLKEFESSLGGNNFYRTHQSFFINLSKIDKYDKRGYVYLVNGKKIPVSKSKREEFLRKLLD